MPYRCTPEGFLQNLLPALVICKKALDGLDFVQLKGLHMSVPAKQIIYCVLCLCALLGGGASWAQVTVAQQAQHAAQIQRQTVPHQPAAPVAATMPPREAQAREAIAGQDLLMTLSSRVNEANRRLQVAEERLSAQMGKTTWLLLAGLSIMIVFSVMASFAGFQYARHLAERKERQLIEEGKEPMSVLIHATRDHVTRLGQRLRMAGATDTRLYDGLMAALPPLQVEAGKATINLPKQIPRSEHAHLEGPVVPLDKLARPERVAPMAVQGSSRSALSAADVGVASIGKNRAVG